MEEEEAEEDEKSEYFYRLIVLVYGLGTDVLLKLFKKYIPQDQTVDDFLNSKANKLDELKKRKVLNNFQIGILDATPPDVKVFDITLLAILISNLTNIQPPRGGWKHEPPPSDRSAGAMLKKFKQIRNETIAHWPKSTMKKSEFEEFWKSTRNNLVALAAEISQTEKDHVEEKIKEIKNKQLDEDQRCKLTAIITRKMQEDIVLLKQKMEEQMEERESISGDVETLQSSSKLFEVQLKDLEDDMKKFDDIRIKMDQQSDLSVEVDNMKASFKNLETMVQGFKCEMSRKMEELEGMAGDVDTLKSSVEILDVQQKDHSKKMEEQKEELESMSGDVDTLKSSVEILDVQQKDHSKKVDEHGRKILALEGQVTFPAKEKVTDQMKHNLQKELVDHYHRNGYCKTTITPLNDDEQVEIEQLFVEPIFKRVKHDSFSKASGNENEEKDTESKKLLEDILRKERRVCVSGNAGQGKTTLCQKIVSSWCIKVYDINEPKPDIAGQGKTTLCQKIVSFWCSKVYDNNEPEPDIIYKQLLKPFDYLFYIHLRNHSISDVVEMIETDIVRKASCGVLKEVLENESEKCLIILDGLDEWMPPKDCKHNVPYIDEKEKFTVLITSRPWKLEKLRPNDSEIGQEVTFCGIDEDIIVEGIVNILNKKYNKGKDWHDFIRNEQYEKGKHLAEIPMILKQMVCMWYDGEEFGNTRVEIYCKMMEYLFNVAFKRGEEGGKDTCKTLLKPQKSTNEKLVNVFKDCSHCKEYSELLSKLSKLAYHTLFSEEKESSLVFRHSDAGCKELRESNVDFCVTVGILSQSKLSGKVGLQQKRLSFLHKTFQEFLAAIFIAYGREDNFFDSMLKTLISLDDVLEMSEVLIFLSGLNPDLIGDISNHVALLTDKDERVLQYRSSLWKEELSMFGIQDIIRACFDEVPKDKKMDCKVALNDYKWFGHTDRDEKVIPYLDLENVKSFQQYHLFMPEGPFLPELRGHAISKLCVKINSQKDVCPLTSIVERCVLPLQCLSVNGTFVMNHVYSLNDLLIALNKVRHLTCIELSYLKLAHSDIKNIEGFLSHKTELKEIILGRIECATCELGHCKYMIDLSHHKQLQYLQLRFLDGDIVLSDEVALEHCKIIGVKCEASIINKLKLSASLQELEIWANGDNTTATVHSLEEDKPSQLCLYKVLIDVIPTLKNLREIDLKYTDFKNGILKSSPDMTSLKYVYLSNCTMTLQCLQSLIDSLLQIQIIRVVMYNVRICPKGDLATAVEYITDRFLVEPVYAHRNSMKLTGKFNKFKGNGDDTENDEDDSMRLNFRPHH